MGLSHRQTVLLIYAVCIALGALSLLLSGPRQVYAFLGVFVLIGLALFALSRINLDDADEEAGGERRESLELREAREAREDGRSPAQTTRTG